MNDKQLFYTTVTLLERPFILAATGRGLCYVDTSETTLTDLTSWVKRSMPTFNLIEDYQFMKPYIHQLDAYLKGELTEFDVPLAINGTKFQLTVWEALREIPYGKTVNYSNIAQQINQPNATRAVANAIGANPLLIFIPCHRVIGKDGSLTGFRAGVNLKRQLLTIENAL
ncbi:MAG TPA: methylated-DNA--[protein]-cysteine S-methyltransferase [Pseudogracilibacillus sp.]|nr:methylated-DNA--[protein]-cysteine S-methyltransferase [Pseudogracilibacillus sp.]